MDRVTEGTDLVLTNSLNPVFLRRFSTSVLEIPCLMSASSHWELRQLRVVLRI